MSQANSNPSPFGDQPQQQAPRYRKPRPDLYTMLLVIAWIAILLGILVLYLELSEYDFEYRAAASLSVRSEITWTNCSRHTPCAYYTAIGQLIFERALSTPAALRTTVWSGAACQTGDHRPGEPGRHHRC